MLVTGRSSRLGLGVRLAVSVTALAVLAACSPGSLIHFGASDNPLQSQLVSDVTGDGAVPHLEALQRIADANGGNRASPSPGYDASVDYVVGVLRDIGYDVSTPTYPAPSEDEDGGTTDVRNVIAQTRTGNADRVVMIGAHLDSVPGGPGINDNGTGVAALLEIAKHLGSSPSTRNAVRFAFWGSEEADLDGSTHYVETLSGRDRQNIMLYINLDMLGSLNTGYFVQGGQGRRSSSTGPPGSAEVAKVLAEQLAAAGVTAETTTFDAASDYEPFVEADIPSGGLLSGDEDEMSKQEAERWGGQAGQVFDSCYHRSCDRLDNVNRTAFDRFTDATAGTIAHFAMSTSGLAH